MNLEAFFRELSRCAPGPHACNPWRDFHPDLDVGEEAPGIRLKHLQQFLRARRESARYVLIGEALGYQGGRFSGIPLTSERILLGQQPRIERDLVLPDGEGRRTSRPDSPRLNPTQRRLGFSEPTATVVWEELIRAGISRHTVMWNVYPFHPYDPVEGELKNRPPRREEIELGSRFVRLFLQLFPGAEVIAVGNKASDLLLRLGCRHAAVPHPSYGNAVP